MCDIETRVRDLRKEIVSCIKEPTIVSHLEARSVISTDYQHLKALLLSEKDFDEFSAHAKTVMRLFTPYLEKIVIAKEFVSELRARDVINGTDEDVILAMFANKGDIYSTMVLLERMQCRVAPQKWYYEFLDVLMKKDHQQIVQEMEPDFIANPSSFMPRLGPINDEECEQYSKTTQIDEAQGACGSIREHIVADFEEGDMDTNDLGAPPTPPVRQDSLQESMLESNLKELNIKPEMIKSFHVNSADLTGREEARNEGSSDEDDSSSLDSDYENKEAETEAISAHTAAPLNLRKYQLELAENAILGRNTIICAETGSGKTWVALHIIQKHLQQTGNGPRKVVFMARTGALIKQQSDRFKAYLPEFQTKLITGDDDESRMLNMFVENYDILCFTPQILVNNLEDNVIKSLSEFSLLILDECHHTRGDGPYSTLMRKYLVEKAQTRNEMPQVVGLTASIGVGKSRTDMEAVEYILRVCACLDVRLLSTVERNLPELKKHINMPDEETIQLVEQRDDPCKHEIMTAMEQTEDMLQDNSLMQPDMIDLMDKQPRNRESQEYNKWTVDVMKAALLKVDDYDVSRDISSCAKYLNTYNSALEVNKLLLAKDVIKYLAEKHRQEGENKSKLTEMERNLYSNLQAIQKTMNVKGKNTENPNVRILSDTLRKMLEEKGDASRAMVFVKARATCRSLATFLDKDLKNSGISASPLYGKENRGGDDGMTESQQTEILEKFREGFYKVLVCTSVGNEGIDIPDCNIVLSYEYSGDEITKIQMKGRARKKEATTITMGSDKVVEQERINAYKAAMMYRALKRVQELDPKYFSMKVTAFQKEETHKYRFKAEVEKLKKGRKSDEDFEILCGRCNTFACYVSDVRQLGHDHIVIDKAFADKITRKEHKKPKTYDGLHKKYKMFCKKCPLDWGIIGIRDGLDCMILKIMNFKFRNLRTRGVSTYKKWIDMPYNVPEIRLEDLPRLLGTEDE
ncbi:antiviral innate immune response receptor RIG-I-like isoform X2 [Mercenaria mercenaria]|uniref:antiviral innate immune response receptor RIG-I-like isoform X2 n=1 Tax=Mercenaria mercenaria TaxID=6596 RepID=UPI00234E5FAB|nr:antiviral innate immune response receptor RIG-I-like isoform X2 [Mercenaria mercenaria]